jgi:hypothetical protein
LAAPPAFFFFFDGPRGAEEAVAEEGPGGGRLGTIGPVVERPPVSGRGLARGGGEVNDSAVEAIAASCRSSMHDSDDDDDDDAGPAQRAGDQRQLCPAAAAAAAASRR